MGKAPQPTPPKETSAASTATNVSTAVANSWLGNFNEYGPDGSREFEQSGVKSVFDPYTGKTHRVPTFDVTTTLSPGQARIKKEQDKAAFNLSRLANDQSAFIGDYLEKPFKYRAGQHEKWAGNLYDRLNRDSYARDQDALRTQLANQGLEIGSQAYTDAMRDMYSAQNLSRDQFMLDSYRTGFDAAQAQRNQPINEITALLSGGQVSMPAFSTSPTQVQMPTTDNAKIIGDYDNARINAYNANMNALIGGIGAVGGLFTSDERVKEDKRKIGETDKGLGLYTFRFKGDPTPQFGLMAQEVEKKNPKAVVTVDGIKRVNYKEALK